MRLFENRLAAAQELARHLSYLRDEDPIVLGLANEGIQVAEVVARELDAPLDVLLLKRLRAPDAKKQIVGVVDEFGRISMIESTARWHHLSSQEMIEPAREAFRALRRKRAVVRRILPSLEVINRTVIIVDQGVGTGARMLGAVASVRDRDAKRIIVAAPAGPSAATWQLHDMADQVVIPHRPTKFTSIEDFYKLYTDVSDDVMVGILERWVSSHPPQPTGSQTLVMKITNDAKCLLCCELDLPPGAARGSGPYPAVIFAHGFESDARSPRTVPISQRLAKRGIIGVRFDFTGHGRSDGRLDDATDERMINDLHLVHLHIARLKEVDATRVGINGSGTGGMLALAYAAARPEIAALVIRGPVCGEEIGAAANVHAPTLLVHAERDTALNSSIEALDSQLASSHQLLRIPDCNRLFSDPISLELMIDASVHWLQDHLAGAPGDTDAPAEAEAAVEDTGSEVSAEPAG